MPKIFSKDQKIKVIQYGENAKAFSFKNIANDWFASIRKMMTK